MNVSLYCSGQTIAELSEISSGIAAASKLMRGLPLIKVRRLRATQPDKPCPIFIVAFSSFGASTPAANRHFSESLSCW